MAELEIEVEGTPNPKAAKFTLDRPLPYEESRSCFEPDDAEGDPLAEGLMALEGVEAILMLEDFITVTRSDEAAWDDLVDDVIGVIRRELPEDGDG